VTSMRASLIYTLAGPTTASQLRRLPAASPFCGCRHEPANAWYTLHHQSRRLCCPAPGLGVLNWLGALRSSAKARARRRTLCGIPGSKLSLVSLVLDTSAH